MSLENEDQFLPEDRELGDGLQDEGNQNLPASDAVEEAEFHLDDGLLEEDADVPDLEEPLTDPDYYRENIRRMKEELKLAKQEERKRRKEDRGRGGSGLSVGGSIALAFFCTAVGCALALLLLTAVPTPKTSLLARYTQYFGTNSVSNVVTVPPANDVTIQVSDSNVDSLVEAIYQKAQASCVGIRVTETTGRFWDQTTETVGEGSGIVYSKDGLIVTNHHVVEAAIDTRTGKVADDFTIRVYLQTDLSVFCKAELVGFDATTDLALLKIQVDGELLPITFADSSTISVGEMAVAIGSPGGLEFMNSVSSGIISGVDRNISTDTGIAYGLLQTDAAINPGNSGGALLNKKGELIGICVIKLVSTGYEGMGFAITSNTIRSIVETLKTDGVVVRPSLGVTVDTTYNLTLAEQMNFPVGALVVEVSPGTAADKAGLKVDDIICGINDVTIQTFYDLRNELLKYKPGDTITLKVFRTGTKTEIRLTAVLDEAK